MTDRDNGWSGRSRGGSSGYGFFILLIRKTGIRPAYALLSLVVIYFIPFAPKATKAIWRYNRRILRYGRVKSALSLYRHYYTFGQTLIDKIAINNGLSDRYEFLFDDYDRFLAILDAGPAVIIGAHVGCWEIGSHFFGDYAPKLNVVMYDGEYQKIKDTLRKHPVPYNIIAVNEGGIESVLKIKQAFDGGGYVCFQGDRYLDPAGAARVGFMGGEALFPKGPAQIASKFGTPVIFYFAMRERGMRYRFIFSVFGGEPTPDTILRSYAAELESVVRRYPRQWFNFYDLWQRG